MLGNVIESFEEKKNSICIFLDFAKAFDKVNYQILLKKFNNYGIRGHSLRWFESYLHERKQCVSVGNSNSDIEILTNSRKTLVQNFKEHLATIIHDKQDMVLFKYLVSD